MRLLRTLAARSARVRRFSVLASLFVAAVSPATARAQMPRIEVRNDAAGSRIQVNGTDMLLRGVNWDYFPIGTNYAYSLWAQPDDVIKTALDREMGLLKVMGVNVIRQYNGIPPRWVRYIYERHGIFTVLNHALGRYGTTATARVMTAGHVHGARTTATGCATALVAAGATAPLCRRHCDQLVF